MKKLFPFFIFILLYGYCYGQKLAYFQTLIKPSGNQEQQGCSILQLADRGFILSGAYDIHGDHPKILVTRTDSLGRVLWTKTYGGDNDKNLSGYVQISDEQSAADMVFAPDSNIVICTSTLSYGAAEASFYLMKIDKNGKIFWARAIGPNKINLGYALVNATGGGFVLAGYSTKYNTGDSERVMLIKTNDTGGVVWAKSYGGNTGGSTNEFELAFCITGTQDGGYVVGGTADGGKYVYSEDDLFMKVDKNGKLLWAKEYGTKENEWIVSLTELPDHSIYAYGYADSDYATIGTSQLIKLDSSGNLLWAKNYGNVNGMGIDVGYPSAMYYDPFSKSINMTAFLPDSLYFYGLYNLKTDTSGKVIHFKEFSTGINIATGIGASFISIAGGGSALISSSYSVASNIPWEIYFVKVDSGGASNLCTVPNRTVKKTAYPMADHSYSFSTRDESTSVVSAYASSTINMSDTSYCAPFFANFRYKNNCSDTVQFYDSTYQYPTSWKWDFGEPGSSSNTSGLKTPVHVYAKTGTYTVRLISSNGTVVDTSIQKINVGSPTPFKFDTLICAGTKIKLKAFGGVNYLWSPGKLVSDSISPTPTTTPKRTTDFIVQVISAQGCITNDTIHATVDNKPSAPKIDYATIKLNNEIDLKFQRSDSNDVKYYEIFRSVNGGQDSLIRTINDQSNKDSFYFIKDSSVNTAVNKYSYKIFAVDSCGATSDTSISHQPMLLAVKQLGCVQTLQLNWSGYLGWPSIRNYEIYRSTNSGPDSLVATLSNTIANYNNTGLNHKNLYCYKILALDNADSFVSQSNIICKQTFFPDTPRIVSVSKISTSTTNGTVVIKWNSINKTNLAYNELYYSSNGVHFSQIGGHLLPGIDSIIQTGLDTKDSDYYFYLVTVDSCNTQSVQSPVSKTMTLKVSVGQLLHKLNWTPYIGFKVKQYQIQRFEKGQFVTIDSVYGTDTFSREFPAPCNYAIRYRIVAMGTEPVEVAWSDTMGRQAIDTIPSDPPIIQNARVLSGSSASLSFKGSDSADSYKFVIQRAVDGNWGTAGSILFTKPADSLQYIDNNVNTVNDQVCYTVITLDSCLNASSSDTICLQRLTGSGLFCTAKARLNWPTFSKPPTLPDTLNIYRSTDDIHFKKTVALTSNLSGYRDTSVSVGQTYYYTMSTVYKSGTVSYSDTINIIPKIIPEADSAQIVYATVIKSDESKGAVYIKWKRAMLNDTNARGYYLYSLNSTNGKYALLKDISDLNDTTFINSNINTIKDVNKYYVLTYNVCDVGINSNIHRTVLLNVKGKNLSEQLNWINYLGVPVKNYSIYKSVDGGTQNLVKNIGTDSSYLDSNISCNHNITYQIQAILANGEISFSDSLTVKSYDSIRPITKPITDATVIRTDVSDGRIKLSWNGAIDNNLLGYNVYRSENGFLWQLIVGGYPSTSFKDSGLDTYDYPYFYKIQPVDSCGNMGIFTIYHETMNLNASSGNGFNQLSWNGYSGWSVKKYLLYRDGILIDTFANNTFAFKDSAIICHIVYEYLLKAVDADNDTILSASNTDSARAANHIPPQKVYIKTVTVSKPNKAATITWAPSSSYDVKNYYIYRKSAIDGSMRLIDSTTSTSYSDSSETITEPDCYYVFARDNCGNQSDGSNQGCIIMLTAKNQPGYNDVSWNSYQTWYDGVQSYNVYKNEDGTGWQLIGTTSSVQINQFKDSKLGDSTIDFCYQVEAIENPGQYNQLSRSTVECVHQDATVFIPNSFTPYNQDGLNDYFGPKGLYIKSYDMKIYNRWGELIYSEQIPLAPLKGGIPSNPTGWDGTFHGQNVQQGIYIYMITVTDYNGKQSYFKGTVTMFE